MTTNKPSSDKPIIVKPISTTVMASLSVKLGLLNGLYHSAHRGLGVAAIAGFEQLSLVPADAVTFAAALAGGMTSAAIVHHAARPWLNFQKVNKHTLLMADLHNYSLEHPELLETPVGKTPNGELVLVKSFIEEFRKSPGLLYPQDYERLQEIRNAAVDKYPRPNIGNNFDM